MISPDGLLFTRPHRRFIQLWAALALLNLAVGVALALQPERSTDLESMMSWGRQWLIGGLNVYALPDRLVDYPPNAVVLLSPLSVLPLAVAFPAWVVANLALAFLAPYFAARFFQPHAPFSAILLPILMFASWWGTHTLVQFSLLSLTLSMAALMWADDRPLLSGVCLGLALMKPQMALPVFLWMVFTRRWQRAAVAAGTVAAGFAAYCARSGAAPVAVVEQYLAIVRIHLTGDALMTGASDLRPFIHLFVSNVSTLDTIAGGLSLALFAGICAAGFQEGRRRSRMLYSAPPLAACWSLLTFYHLSYGFVILLPVLMLLVFNDAPRTSLRRGLLWTLQIGMMLNVPGLLRHSGLADKTIAGALISHFDRFFTLAIFAGLLALARRESVPRSKTSATSASGTGGSSP